MAAIVKLRVELFPQRKEMSVDLPDGADGMRLMKSLELAPDVHILVRDGVPIPIDSEMRDGDRIRIIAVVSGG